MGMPESGPSEPCGRTSAMRFPATSTSAANAGLPLPSQTLPPRSRTCSTHPPRYVAGKNCNLDCWDIVDQICKQNAEVARVILVHQKQILGGRMEGKFLQGKI